MKEKAWGLQTQARVSKLGYIIYAIGILMNILMERIARSLSLSIAFICCLCALAAASIFLGIVFIVPRWQRVWKTMQSTLLIVTWIVVNAIAFHVLGFRQDTLNGIVHLILPFWFLGTILPILFDRYFYRAKVYKAFSK